MNREIEFRIWDKTKEQMRYDITGFECSRNAIDGVFIDGDYFNLQNGILMQYTGLKDKNGKKIFEGDIMKNKQGGIGIVKYSKYAEFILDFVDDIFVSSFNPSILRHYEVIGNIYEDNLESEVN